MTGLYRFLVVFLQVFDRFLTGGEYCTKALGRVRSVHRFRCRFRVVFHAGELVSLIFRLRGRYNLPIHSCYT